MGRKRRSGRIGSTAVVVILVAVVGLGALVLARTRVLAPLPGEQRCVATAAGHTTVVDLDQAYYASLVAAVAVDRGLPPRAASIALATAYQESGLRNLGYGDRDSVGLFQQRPSQGWGSAEQLSDPVYAAGRFYDALVKIRGWQTEDITTLAQQVQRSAYPEAYRDHEADGRTLASVLTGHSPAALSCLERRGRPGDAAGLTSLLDRRFRAANPKRAERTITVVARNGTLAWAYGQFVVANAAQYGVASVNVGGTTWTTDRRRVPAWQEGPPVSGAAARTVVVAVRG